jgi:ABC-2 type transport system ATP-binding protein
VDPESGLVNARKEEPMSNDIESVVAPGPPRSVATLEHATRRFGEVTAVDAMSLTMEPGQTVALLGPNGAGKTTAVEMLLGLLRPDDGTAHLFGGPPAEAVARGLVGAMLQDAGLPSGATVAELIGLMRGLYPDPLDLSDALRLADLEAVAGRQVQRLSGGQRQRVRLALALAGNPELLVLDEPTSALDVLARRAFWERARASVSEGRTLLFATHQLEEADAVADRAVVISRGRLVADGNPAEIKAQAAARRTGRVPAARLPGLEEAFLALTREEGS